MSNRLAYNNNFIWNSQRHTSATIKTNNSWYSESFIHSSSSSIVFCFLKCPEFKKSVSLITIQLCLLALTSSIRWITEPAEELPQVERTQTDKINSHLLKSFLTRLNTDPQFQNVVPSASDQPEEPTEETSNKSFDWSVGSLIMSSRQKLFRKVNCPRWQD